MYRYNCNELQQDVEHLYRQLHTHRFDTVVALARGGTMIAQLLAYRLNIRDLQLIRVQNYDNDKKKGISIQGTLDIAEDARILLVDDIIDSGESMHALLDYLKERHKNASFSIATVYYKKSATIQPDFTCKEATEWIDFFWEREDR